MRYGDDDVDLLPQAGGDGGGQGLGEARRAALEQMQTRTRESGKLPEWLRRHGLENALPLWQQIHVDAGWESAVEAVLRERLNAIACDDPAKLDEWLHDRPDAKLSVMLPSELANGERAGRLWDGVVLVGGMDEFFEMKRSRTREPDFS